MSTKIEPSTAPISESPPIAMASLAEKSLERLKAFKILDCVFPYDEYATACSVLAAASNNTETITIGTLFNVTAKLSLHGNEHYMNRLVGRLSMENMGAYDDLDQLSSLALQTVISHMKKHPDERVVTYHMRSCYCHFNKDEEEEEDEGEDQ